MPNVNQVIKEYETHRLVEGIHINTVAMEIRYIQKFHNALVDGGEYIPLENITYKLVEAFFKRECDVLSERTVYRKITIIIQYFNYLSSKGYILIDFMAKFRSRFKKLAWDAPALEFSYEDMLKHKSAILSNGEISLTSKLIFICMLYGMELKELLNLKVEQITIFDTQTLIQFDTVMKNERIIVITDELERQTIANGLEMASTRGVDYLISGKSDGMYQQYNPTNIPTMMKPISNTIGHLLTTKKTLYAYVFYLHQTKRYTVEDIAAHLALSKLQATNLLKTVVERIEQAG